MAAHRLSSVLGELVAEHQRRSALFSDYEVRSLYRLGYGPDLSQSALPKMDQLNQPIGQPSHLPRPKLWAEQFQM